MNIIYYKPVQTILEIPADNNATKNDGAVEKDDTDTDSKETS